MQFAVLIFATLAFSIQFHASIGKQFRYWLIGSWTCLALSGFVAGYRIQQTSHFDNLNYKANVLEESIKVKVQPLASPAKKEFWNQETGTKFSESDYREGLSAEQRLIKSHRGQMERINRWGRRLGKLQVLLFALGVIAWGC